MDPETRLERLAAGESPALIAKMPSGFAVMADNQYLPGYCLLLAYPQVGKLNDLKGRERAQFLNDMAALGDALLAATGCLRVNYGTYGNLDPFLHTHLWPRYAWESEEMSTIPPFTFPIEFRTDPANEFSPESHGALQEQIRAALNSR